MKTHTSTERLFQIIEILSSCKAVDIEEIVAKSDIPYTTVYRILHTCIKNGYVTYSSNNKFKLTQKIFFIVSAYVHEHHNIAEVAHLYLKKLSYDIKDTLHLGILEDNKVLYIDKIETKYKIRMHSYIGYQAEIHCTALGKIICAYLPTEEMEEIIKTIPYNVYTPFTIKNKTKLREELTCVSSQGYAEDNEENEMHLYCISVPIFNNYNTVVAAISTSTLLFRFDKKDKNKTITLLWKAAAEISEQLGNQDYHTCLGITTQHKK